MLIGNQTDEEADSALDALSSEEEPKLVGLTEVDLDDLLGEDF